MQVNSGEDRQQIALYGGAFDPVHNAHLQLARSALEQGMVGEVCFIPAAQSPLKQHGAFASDAQRLEMLALATADKPHLEVSDYEIVRGGVSYSYQTAEHFCSRRPDVEFFWILGADQFELLSQWRNGIHDTRVCRCHLAQRLTWCRCGLDGLCGCNCGTLYWRRWC